MKVRLILPKTWTLFEGQEGTRPIASPLLWPADRAIPEGYEELEIAPKWISEKEALQPVSGDETLAE